MGLREFRGHTFEVVVIFVGARVTEPRAFGDSDEDRPQTEQMEASVALVAEKKLRRRIAGPAFLTQNGVVLGIGVRVGVDERRSAEREGAWSLGSPLPRDHSLRPSRRSHS